MDTFDVRKYITENNIKEQEGYERRYEITFTDGSTEQIGKHISVSPEDVIGSLKKKYARQGKEIKNIEHIGIKPIDLYEEKDVIEPDPQVVDGEERAKEIEDEGNKFKKDIDKYLAKTVVDKFEEDEDGNTQYDLIKKNNVLRAVKSVRENGTRSLTYNELIDEPTLEEALLEVNTAVVKLALRNDIKNDPGIDYSEANDYLTEYIDLFDGNINGDSISISIEMLFNR